MNGKETFFRPFCQSITTKLDLPLDFHAGSGSVRDNVFALTVVPSLVCISFDRCDFRLVMTALSLLEGFKDFLGHVERGSA